MKLIYPSIALMFFLVGPSLAQTLSTEQTFGIKIERAGTEVEITVERFPESLVRCGVSVDAGDGTVRDLRFEDGQSTSVMKHVYKEPGVYKVAATGKGLMRGLRSLVPCVGSARSMEIAVGGPSRTPVAGGGQRPSVQNQFEAKIEAQRKAGMVQAARDQLGALENKKTADRAVYLIKGMRYVLNGVCDDDCKRLDISLLDENDVKVASHATTNDAPVINVTPTATGKYTLRVLMMECTVDPCDWGVRTYSPR